MLRPVGSRAHIAIRAGTGSVDAMSADRPQYGEYASPEEQRARAGLPPLEQVPTASAPAPAPPAALPPQPRPQAGARPASRADRMVTAILLGIGLVNVVTSVPGFFNLSDSLDQSLKMLGIDGSFSNFAAARIWGAIAAAVLIAGYATTVWLSVRRIKRGRITWWLPLVGLVVTMIAVSICISVPMFGDPAFSQSVVTPPAG